MSKVLVLYYSAYGHIEKMAEAVAEGARAVPGTEVTIKRVPELVPEEIAKNFDATRESLLSERREQMFAVFVTALTDRYQKEGGIRMNKRAQTGLAQGMQS